MKKFDIFMIAIAIIMCGATIWGVIDTNQRINAKRESERKEHQTLIAGYKSPVDRTDSDRLDWLDKHRDKTPWVQWESDPRREIDYLIDQEAVK